MKFIIIPEKPSAICSSLSRAEQFVTIKFII